MNSRKIRTYPPIFVSLAVTMIFSVAAIASVGGNIGAEASEKTTQAETQPQPQTSQELLEITPLATPIAPEQETTYASIIGSRDFSGEDSEMLMKIAMAEAEGESVEGKALVMLVVLNRVWSENFPDTIEEVIFQPRQFSPVKEGGRYYTAEPDEDCYRALLMVMYGWDESYGALYFESCDGSSWHSENLDFLYQVGNHKFYK